MDAADLAACACLVAVWAAPDDSFACKSIGGEKVLPSMGMENVPTNGFLFISGPSFGVENIESFSPQIASIAIDGSNIDWQSRAVRTAALVMIPLELGIQKTISGTIAFSLSGPTRFAFTTRSSADNSPPIITSDITAVTVDVPYESPCGGEAGTHVRVTLPEATDDTFVAAFVLESFDPDHPSDRQTEAAVLAGFGRTTILTGSQPYGSRCYQIIALDAAANPSAPSAPICLDLTSGCSCTAERGSQSTLLFMVAALAAVLLRRKSFG
jgi:uncharacterized protein (TIGR03382 family)